MITVPEIIDPVFAKTSPNPSFSMTEYERFGLVFTKTRVYKFGHRGIYTVRKRRGSGIRFCGEHHLELYTVYLTRFLTYKFALPPQTKT